MVGNINALNTLQEVLNVPRTRLKVVGLIDSVASP